MDTMMQDGADVTPRKVVPAQGKLLKGKGRGSKYNAVGQDTT